LFSPFSAWFPGGATIFQPYTSWPRPLTEPDVRFSRIRLFKQAHLLVSDSRFSFVDNSLPALSPVIVSPPRYTCLSTPSLLRHYPSSSVLWVDPTTYASSSGLVSSTSGTPIAGGKHRSSQVPVRSFGQHPMDYDPGGVSAISPITMASLLPSMFLITWACSTT